MVEAGLECKMKPTTFSPSGCPALASMAKGVKKWMSAISASAFVPLFIEFQHNQSSLLLVLNCDNSPHLTHCHILSLFCNGDAQERLRGDNRLRLTRVKMAWNKFLVCCFFIKWIKGDPWSSTLFPMGAAQRP